MVGKTGSEFVDGVKSGIDYTFNCTITVAEPLQKAGISTGKFYLQKDTVKQNYSILSAYIIFGQDYNGTLTAKVFDKNKNEYGSATITVTGKKNEAHYYDWHFDTRTNVEARSLIMLEQ